MNGSRLKTIILLLLLTVVVILGAVFGWRILTEERMAARAAEDGAEVLSGLGIEVDAKLLRQQTDALNTLEKERSLDIECALAAALIGAEQLEAQGGGIYTAETERGRFRISNAGVFELTLYTPYPQGVSAEITADELVQFAMEQFAEEDRAEVRGGVQFIDGVPVFGRDISVRVGADGELSANGGLLLGEIYVSSAGGTYSLTAALMALADELKLYENGDGSGLESVTVLKASLGYSAELIAENYTELRPTWQVVTSGGTYLIDALDLDILA